MLGRKIEGVVQTVIVFETGNGALIIEVRGTVAIRVAVVVDNMSNAVTDNRFNSDIAGHRRGPRPRDEEREEHEERARDASNEIGRVVSHVPEPTQGV